MRMSERHRTQPFLLPLTGEQGIKKYCFCGKTFPYSLTRVKFIFIFICGGNRNLFFCVNLNCCTTRPKRHVYRLLAEGKGSGADHRPPEAMRRIYNPAWSVRDRIPLSCLDRRNDLIWVWSQHYTHLIHRRWEKGYAIKISYIFVGWATDFYISVWPAPCKIVFFLSGSKNQYWCSSMNLDYC